MNALQAKYGKDSFVVLGFPCTQFHYQEPGVEAEILNGIKHVRPGNGFVPNFQMFAKIDVNGPTEAPLYKYLKNRCEPTTDVFNDPWLMYSPIKAKDVAWNWETFLVGVDGRVVSRAPPPLDPMDWASAIEAELLYAIPNTGQAGVGK